MKTIHKVFLIVGTLVLIFILWQVFFNDGGVLQTGYNAVVDTINGVWNKLTGGTAGILPNWGDVGAINSNKSIDKAGTGF